MTSTAKYMKILLARRHRPQLGPQALMNREITENPDLDILEGKPPEDRSLTDIRMFAALKRHFSISG